MLTIKAVHMWKQRLLSSLRQATRDGMRVCCTRMTWFFPAVTLTLTRWPSCTNWIAADQKRTFYIKAFESYRIDIHTDMPSEALLHRFAAFILSALINW